MNFVFQRANRLVVIHISVRDLTRHVVSTVWYKGTEALTRQTTDDSDFGANVLPNGDLDGFAWAENVGWVNFGWGADSGNVV